MDKETKDRILAKLEKVQLLIDAWISRESIGKSDGEVQALFELTLEDRDFVGNELWNEVCIYEDISKDEMRKCNSIYRRYSAISNVEVTLKGKQK